MVQKTSPFYQQIVDLSRKAALYSSIETILHWDQETYMPKKAMELRSTQFELLANLIHKERTSKEFRDALEKFIDLESGNILDPNLSAEQQAALGCWRRDFLKTVKLPTEFVEEWAKTTTASTHAWLEAKQKNDFKAFLPYLKKIIDLSLRKADYLGYEDHPYDALVDEYEPMMRTATLIPLFEKLKIPLTTFLKKIQTKSDPDNRFLHKDYNHDKQLKFGKFLLSAMGFDKSFSRLDESGHPMCIGVHPDDTRMTTRIYPNNVLVNILSCIHEGGHGLYQAHLPKEHFGTPLGETVSLGIHESQSRTWETIIGRSLPFWKHFFPLLQEQFPENLANISLEEFYAGMNLVEPSMIRTDSDEVSYNLHIMIRFELELALLEGTLASEKLPEVWNEKMREYLGITPKADSEGCLQDIHWAMGGIGYFPTYTLGNLYAAQMFESFAEEYPNWQTRIASGELKFLQEWLTKEVHRHGRRYLPNELCEKVTGSPLTEKPFLSYLETKYTPLYHL